ncbi:MAG: outer membrane lipoprotein LolB [Burkholderiales bacterium]|nr:outer membrane lipoprotein LolB [Burkholderiales bacterium]
MTLGLGLLLAACATPPRSDESAWTAGRLSVQVAADDGQAARGMSAAFQLRGNGDAGELRLDSPLGLRMASARWAPGLAVLQTSDGEHRYDSLDALSREALGEALPLAALPDWLAGRPWPGAPHLADSSGFEQLGWHVVLTRQAQGWIEARRDAPPVVTLRARLDAAGS